MVNGSTLQLKTTLMLSTHQMRQSVQSFLWALKLILTLQLLLQEQLCLLGLFQRKPRELNSWRDSTISMKEEWTIWLRPSQWKWGRRLISRKRLKQPLEQAPLKNSLDNLKSSSLKSSSTIQTIDCYMNQKESAHLLRLGTGQSVRSHLRLFLQLLLVAQWFLSLLSCLPWIQ